MKTVRIVLLALAVIVAVTGSVSAEDTPDFDTAVLESIDTVPTRAQLDDTWPDARQRLMKAAGDAGLGVYQRHRAISLLSLYPEPQTRSFLEELAREAKPAIRKLAVYSVARTFGVPGDEGLVRFVAEFIEDDEAEVREWAVRSLRWIQHERSAATLRTVVAGSDDYLKPVARRALSKWIGASDNPTKNPTKDPAR